MGYIAKERGRYRVRFRDPLGRVHSKTFVRKSEADRYLREVDANEFRGQWVDPRDGQMPLAACVEEFLSLSRRLSRTTQQTYRRDLDKYVLPRSVAIGWGSCRPTRSRTGSTTRSRLASRRRRCTGTTEPFAAFCRLQCRSRRSCRTRASGWTHRTYQDAR